MNLSSSIEQHACSFCPVVLRKKLPVQICVESLPELAFFGFKFESRLQGLLHAILVELIQQRQLLWRLLEPVAWH